MIAAVSTGSGPRQASSSSLTRVAGALALGPSFTAFSRPKGVESEVKQPRHKLMPIWDIGIVTVDGFNCYTTVPYSYIPLVRFIYVFERVTERMRVES